MHRVWNGLWAIVLVIFLTGCGSIGAPSRHLVEQAIVQQLHETQAALNQQLRLTVQPTDLTIKRVLIQAQTPLTIEGLGAYRIQGTYNATIKLPTRQVTEQQNPFDVYLQRQKEGKTWRLARLSTDDDGEPIWITQRLQ
ncbi:MAG: hypothetical protein KME27_07690 [Lyngbya sp. HA4199-MV5]|jgi:hypothetical protein|nr:hypothetical protein [Lyngbya sp. HA4199-MV5]